MRFVAASEERAGFLRRRLGASGLLVSALGISSSYGVPARAVEEAFALGVNYLYWGSLRRRPFGEALKNLRSRREELILVLQSFWPYGWMVERSLVAGLRAIGYDYADVLLLGYWNRPLPPGLLDHCARLRARGLVRAIGVSSHSRKLLGLMASQEGTGIDVVHLRYNAAHRGAETDIFPKFGPRRPGVVAYTATSWAQLLDPKLIPPGERPPTAADCYRFVLSHPAVDVCITGPGTEEEARAIPAALSAGPMTEEELNWMRRVGDAVCARARRH